MSDQVSAVEQEPPIEVVMRPIGRVSTTFTEPADTPIQSQRDPHGQGRVHVDARFRSGLDGLHEFDFVFLITHLDRQNTAHSDHDDWRVVPFLLGDTEREIGTFATRHPSRPNPLGLSLVRVTATYPDGFDFEGVDVLDGTPVLDIKPWVPAFDTPRSAGAQVRIGWYGDAALDRHGVTPAELTGNGGEPSGNPPPPRGSSR